MRHATTRRTHAATWPIACKDAYIKLTHAGARWLDPALGRWTTADSIVPSPGNPQTLNRFSYVKANPLRYTDPTGHCAPNDTACQRLANLLYTEYGWTVDGVWTYDDVHMLWRTAGKVELYFAKNGGGDARGRTRATFGEVAFKPSGPLWPWPKSSHTSGHTVHRIPGHGEGVMAHELGHVLDNALDGDGAVWSGGGPADDMSRHLGGTPETCALRYLCAPALLTPYGGYRKYDPSVTEPLPAGAYAAKGPAEDFAETFEREVMASGGYPQRSQWMANLMSLQVATVPEFSAVPFPAVNTASTSVSRGNVR